MQNLPPDPKFSEKRTITNYFFYLALYQDFSPVLACYLYRQVIRQFVFSWYKTLSQSRAEQTKSFAGDRNP